MSLIVSVNGSMNMIHDIDNPIVKSETLQQLQPITEFAKNALELEKNPEILDDIASYVSCSMEVRAIEMAKLLHNRANEIRKIRFGIDTPDVSILFDNEQQIGEERTMRR